MVSFWLAHLLLQTLLAVRKIFKLGVIVQDGAQCWGVQPVSLATGSRSSSESRSNNNLGVRRKVWGRSNLLQIGPDKQTCGVDGALVSPFQRRDERQGIVHVVSSPHGEAGDSDRLLQQAQDACGTGCLPPYTIYAPGWHMWSACW